MLGRGLVANPALVGELRSGVKAKKDDIKAFHDELIEVTRARIGQDRPLLMHMKELWFYLASSFENSEKPLKSIKKAQSFSDYRAAVELFFNSCELRDDAGFHLAGF